MASVLFHSAAGGQGCTVTAAACGLLAANPSAPTLLVDLRGDLAPALGLPDPDRGLLDFLRLPVCDVEDARSMGELVVEVRPGLGLLGLGSPSSYGPQPSCFVPNDAALARMVEAFGAWPLVIVDAGTLDVSPSLFDVEVLVTRSCYLSLRRAVNANLAPDETVLIEEPGRALHADDIRRTLGGNAPVSKVPHSAAIARAVDAGLLSGRVPAELQALAPLVQVLKSYEATEAAGL